MKNKKLGSWLLLCLFGIVGVFSGKVQAATFSVSGGYTFDVNMLTNYDLQSGDLNGYGNTNSYWSHRFLLRPDVIVDDRFTVRSELNLLKQVDSAKNDVSRAFGSSLDGSLTVQDGGQILDVRKVYLEWASDWGLFKIGRQPKDWGLGILYNTGSVAGRANDTIVDRVGFEGMVGNLHLQVGFEKGKEGKLANDSDDVESYEISVEYINEETSFDVGLLYNRTVALATSGLSELAANTLGIYSKKKWGALQLGGEFVSMGYENQDAQMGALAKLLYVPGSWSWGLDTGFATANGSGNYVFQNNYKPLMILFNEAVGPGAGRLVRSNVNIGKPIGSGTDAGSGAYFGVLTGAYTFSSGNYVLGANLGYAQLAKQRSSSGTRLGTEVDVHLTQKWYNNFRTSYALGFLMPGMAFGPSPQMSWGTRITGSLVF